MVVKPLSPRHRENKHSPPSTTQVHRLLEVAHGHRLYPLLLLAATAGLRRSELIGLRWADLDLTNRTIFVAGPTKLGRTGTCPSRVVAVPQQAAIALTRWQERQARERLAGGPFYHNHGYVFTDPYGRRYQPARLARVVRTLMRRAGIHHANLHSLRAFAMIHHPTISIQKG